MEIQDTVAVSADVTHRRTGNACVPCRSGKVRCDGKLPSCQRCLNRRTRCHYGERKGRGLGKSKQYIRTLEERLRDVEVALQVSPLPEKGPSQTSAEPRHTRGIPHVEGRTTTNTTQFLPSRWPKEITRNTTHAQQNMSNLERTVFVPLPPKEHILHFVSNSLEDMHEVQPLFSIHDVLKLVDDQYSAGLSNCHANPTRWAMLNALIAMGIHWKADNKAIEELFPISWEYFKNAFSIFPEIVMNGDRIDSCQVMVVMTLFIKGTADARACTALLSAAAHASHCMGLHLEDLCGSSDMVDIEKRRRCFWSIYVLQCNASINFSLPAPSTEVGVELPAQGPAIDASSSTHLLRHMSTLALIQSRICQCLCLGSSLWKSIDRTLKSLTELDNDLESWKTGLPTEVQPTTLTRVDNLGIVQLHFAYYASTWKIYTAVGKLHNVPLTSIRREHLLLSTPTPTHSARATISLLQSLSPQPLASLWQIICYPTCAVLILFTAVLHSPGDSEVNLNVAWIGKFVRFLQNFQNREGRDLKNLIDLCSKLHDIAFFAQHNPTDQENESENDDTAGLLRQYTDLCIRLRGPEDPMQLAQGLLTNMRLPCAKATEVFSGILTETREDGFTLLVPNVLKPSSFNFFGNL